MRHLSNLGNKFKIPIPVDEKGYIGRQCPNLNCKRYFKIRLGTGLKGENLPLHCPYCGHEGKIADFATQEQIDYAVSIVGRSVEEAVVQDLKDMASDFNRRMSSGLFALKMNVKSSPAPIRYYAEKELETDVECKNCSLQYSVYGVFAFCPDCGQHNSLQILEKNMELTGKMLDMAATTQTEIAGKLVENAFGDCVSAFDGFGRELCRLHASKSSDPVKAGKIPFQNLEGARQNLSRFFKLDLAAGLTGDEWKAAVRGFQKRHLLSHKTGVVDDDYVRKSGDAQAVVGRKVGVRADEVRELVRIVGKMARHVSRGLGGAKSVEQSSAGERP